MGNLTTAVVFIVILNAFLLLSQVSVLQLDSNAIKFYNCDSFSNLDTNQSVLSNLPQQQSIEVATGNIFTDTYSVILSWLSSIPGVDYVLAVFSAPKCILRACMVPELLASIIGTLWYIISLAIIIMFLRGVE